MKQRMLAIAAAACIAIPSLPVGLVDEIKVSAAGELGAITADYAELLGCSVVLDAGISLNYVLAVGASMDANMLNSAYMEFQIGSDETTKQTVYLKNLTPQTIQEKTCYIIPYRIVARQMNDTVSAKLVINDSLQSDAFNYSIKEYADVILAEDSTYSPASKRIVRAMLDYGTSSQKFFSYQTDAPANGGSDLSNVPSEVPESYKIQQTGTIPEGLQYYGMSLLLRSNIGMRQYFMLSEGHDISEYKFSYMDNGSVVPVTPELNGDLYYVEIPDIPAKELTTAFPVSIGSGYTVTACALSYATESYAQGNAKLDEVLRAMYGYNLSAVDYDTYMSYTLDELDGLVINEVVSSNASGFKDSNGNYPDWVEIYNGTEEKLPIEGIGLSEGKKKKFKFVFEEGKWIEPGEHIVVFCDEDEEDNLLNGEYHASFKLSADGETVYLTHPDYGQIDEVVVPALDADVAYGREYDGSENFITLQPTPREKNSTANAILVVPEPTFSKEAGFYTEAFDLEISLPTDAPSGTKIIYTLDGSEPTLENGTQVDNQAVIPITDMATAKNFLSAQKNYCINEGTRQPDNFTPSDENVPKAVVVKAACMKLDSKNQPVLSHTTTHTYFINKENILGTGMHVISLVSDPDNFIDPETGIFVTGNMYDDYLESANGQFEYESYDPKNPTNYNQRGRDWEREVTMQVFKDGTLQYSDNVGLRVSGNATRSYVQKSLNLYARKDYGNSKIKYAFFPNLVDINGKAIDSFDKLTLRNGGNDFDKARIRDDIIHEMSGDLAFDTLAKCDTLVFIDGEFWGYYSLQEKLDEEYVSSHYDIKTGNITVLKCGDDPAEYNDYIREYLDYAKLAATLDMTDPDNYAEFCSKVDIDNFIDYVTTEAYICNYDWANELHTNNWFMWRSNEADPENKYADQKWRFSLYDTEFSTELYEGDSRNCADTNFFDIIKRCTEEGNLGQIFLQLIKNTDFATKFETRYKEIGHANFNAGKVNPAIDERTKRLADAIEMTNARFGISAMNEGEMNRLKDFFTNRYDHAVFWLEILLGKASYPDQGTLVDGNIEWGFSNGGVSSYKKLENGTGFQVVVDETGSDTWSIQARHGGFTLYNTCTYKVSYTLQTTDGAEIIAYVMMDGGAYDEYLTKKYTGAVNQEITEQFTMNSTCQNARISFDFTAPGTYTITNVKLERVNTPTE